MFHNPSKGDVTQPQERLLQTQKLVALGRLVAGVSHDINNMLTVIMGYGDVLQKQLLPDDPKCELIAQIVNASERASTLTHQLLAFSRKQGFEPEVRDLISIVTDLEQMLGSLFGEAIRQFSGSVTIERHPANGTTIKIHLPAAKRFSGSLHEVIE